MSTRAHAETFLAQRRIAVVGVSRRTGTGNAIFKALRKRGFDVVPINPHADKIDGEVCYPRLSAVEGGVGAAVIVTRPAATEAVVRDCVDCGVSHVWMHHNALFGARRSSVSDAAVAHGRENGLHVIVGGCPLMFGQGADLGHRCMRWLLGVAGQLH